MEFVDVTAPSVQWNVLDHLKVNPIPLHIDTDNNSKKAILLMEETVANFEQYPNTFEKEAEGIYWKDGVLLYYLDLPESQLEQAYTFLRYVQNYTLLDPSCKYSAIEFIDGEARGVKQVYEGKGPLSDRIFWYSGLSYETPTGYIIGGRSLEDDAIEGTTFHANFSGYILKRDGDQSRIYGLNEINLGDLVPLFVARKLLAQQATSLGRLPALLKLSARSKNLRVRAEFAPDELEQFFAHSPEELIYAGAQYGIKQHVLDRNHAERLLFLNTVQNFTPTVSSKIIMGKLLSSYQHWSHNITSQKIVESGPDYAIFEIEYAPFMTYKARISRELHVIYLVDDSTIKLFVQSLPDSEVIKKQIFTLEIKNKKRISASIYNDLGSDIPLELQDKFCQFNRQLIHGLMFV